MYFRGKIAAIVIVTVILWIFAISRFQSDKNGLNVAPFVKRRCSFQLYKKLSSERTDGNVDGRGFWTRDRNGSLLQFHPNICRLSHGMWIPSAKLSTCFKSKKIRHIAVVGDSNGRFSTTALHRLLKGQPEQNNSITCTDIQTHSKITYGNHSTSSNMFINRQCQCGGVCTFASRYPQNRFIRHAKCVDKEAMSLLIEYISMMYWQSTDHEMVFGCSRNETDSPVVEAANSQEYIFSDYLTNPRPDVIILNANMWDNYPLSNTAVIEHQLDLLDRFVSNTTQVVLVPLHNIVLAKRGWLSDVVTPDENGKPLNRAEWSRKYTDFLFRVVSKRFISGRKPLLVPNMIQVSQTVTDLNVDGVHMTPDWYQHIMSIVIQNLCDI